MARKNLSKNLSKMRKMLSKDTVHKAPPAAKAKPKIVHKPLTVPVGALKIGDLTARGKVKASFSKTNSMAEIKMLIVNDSSRDVNIELTGGVLHPDNEGFQRLFVAGLQDEPSPTVNIPAGGETEVTLSTCCMDQGKSSPNGTVSYSPSDETPPSSNVDAAYNWMSARQALANIEGSDAPDMQKFCLQNEFKGTKTKKQKTEDDIRRKADLSYVQEVCWSRHKP